MFLIETGTQFQLYDTGPAFGTTFSAANQFVIPALWRAGTKRLDHLIISHGDNDHAGGLDEILARVAVSRTIRYGDCDAHWVSDGVVFRTFPVGKHEWSDGSGSENNRSCLMLIRVHDAGILLTGDIEAGAEYALMKSWPDIGGNLKSVEVISVPHHGSDSSSTPALLNGINPRLAINSSGFLNRFNHPAPAVVARYRRRSVPLLNTASSGAVEILFLEDVIEVREARKEQLRVWRRLDKDI